jgi:hypothetical protein
MFVRIRYNPKGQITFAGFRPELFDNSPQLFVRSLRDGSRNAVKRLIQLSNDDRLVSGRLFIVFGYEVRIRRAPKFGAMEKLKKTKWKNASLNGRTPSPGGLVKFPAGMAAAGSARCCYRMRVSARKIPTTTTATRTRAGHFDRGSLN